MGSLGDGPPHHLPQLVDGGGGDPVLVGVLSQWVNFESDEPFYPHLTSLKEIDIRASVINFAFF